MATATVTSKGQITLPAMIRKHLNLKPGDQIDFIVDREGTVALIPKTVHIKDLQGFLAPASRHVSLEEMERTIRKRASET